MPDPTPKESPQEPIPLGQRLFDNMFLLLVLGVGMMFVIFTGWGGGGSPTLPPPPPGPRLAQGRLVEARAQGREDVGRLRLGRAMGALRHDAALALEGRPEP